MSGSEDRARYYQDMTGTEEFELALVLLFRRHRQPPEQEQVEV